MMLSIFFLLVFGKSSKLGKLKQSESELKNSTQQLLTFTRYFSSIR